MAATLESIQFGKDLLTIAVEGGIGYFAEIVEYLRDDNGDWVCVTVEDAEGEDTFERTTVSYDMMRRGVEAFIAAHPNAAITPDMRTALRDRDPGMMDAEMAAAAFQMAAFGEVVFG